MKVYPLLLTTSIIFILDQTTKILLENISSFVLIPSVLSFTPTKNTGIAFSIPIEGLLLIIITIIIIIIGILYARRYLNFSKVLTQIVCGFILGGALGNLVDRVFNGYVFDFIQISVFPVFNIADMFISIGGILFLIFHSQMELKK